MSKEDRVEIIHKNRRITTKHWCDISDELCYALKKEYSDKPDIHKVYENLNSFRKGNNDIKHIVWYYLADIMEKTLMYNCVWSVEEIFECNDLIRHFYAKILANSDIYLDSESMRRKFTTAFRIGGIGIAQLPSNFPVHIAHEILKKYNTNNKYYDFSCGWGVRLLTSIRQGIEYYGTDPNHLLVDRLNVLKTDYDIVNNKKTTAIIRATGSEIFHDDWVSKFGLAFSSPPYFSMEDYRIGNQSYKTGLKYSEWLEYYILPTIYNVQEYLIDGGYLLINIKNTKDFPMFDDIFDIVKTAGFNFIENIPLDNNRIRPCVDVGHVAEDIMVFMKGTRQVLHKVEF